MIPASASASSSARTWLVGRQYQSMAPRGSMSVELSGPERGPLPHDALRTYERRPGDRSAFCTRCGAHVFGVVDRSDEIEVFLGSFDETNVFTPTYELWTIRREQWLGNLPTLTRHFERDRVDG